MPNSAKDDYMKWDSAPLGSICIKNSRLFRLHKDTTTPSSCWSVQVTCLIHNRFIHSRDLWNKATAESTAGALNDHLLVDHGYEDCFFIQPRGEVSDKERDEYLTWAFKFHPHERMRLLQ